jgi:RNA polymerase sigma-70 factor (ECF subfamily)
MPRFFECEPAEDDRPAAGTGFSPCWHREDTRENYGGRGAGDGFGRSVSRKNGQRRPILGKTEFGPRSQPGGAVSERRRSRLGGFGRTHTRRVYGLCYRFTGKDGEAQDLTQEVFLRVYRTLKTFRATEGAFTTWLARLTRNLLIDNYRRTRQERLTDSIEEQLPRIEESLSAASRPAARTDAMVAGREASEILQAGLQKLSPELREAVILRDLQDLEYREIAAILRIPEGTVKSRLNRGRAELARVLRRQKVLV